MMGNVQFSFGMSILCYKHGEQPVLLRSFFLFISYYKHGVKSTMFFFFCSYYAMNSTTCQIQLGWAELVLFLR